VTAVWDLLVKGGTVVDGTGAAAFTADVGVKEGRIADIGRLDGDAARTLDADGLTVTPGFIDIHTHYDAQLHFEPTASPSSWHGVTTVFTGNCGFTFAPARPDDLDWLLHMLSRVEGMSPEALAAGVTYRGGSFGDFLAGLEGRVGVNVAANVGHCAVRRMVMGDEASERTASDDEVRRMAELVRLAIAEGAVGFTSSQLELHMAHDGRPVPSNLAAPDEIVALAAAAGAAGASGIEFIPRSFLEGYDADDRKLLEAMATASGVPVHTNTLTRMPQAPDGWRRSLDFAAEMDSRGLRVLPMFAANRQGAHFSLDTTFLFDEYPSLRETLTLPEPERSARLRDPSVRERVAGDLSDHTGKSFLFIPQVLRFELVHRDEHQGYVDRTVSDVAAERGQTDLDCFLDVSLSEGLRTQFVLAAPPDASRREATETMIRSALTMAGSSDAGAHLLSFCGVDFTTRLLTEWAPDVLTFEEAVSRLTMVPASVHGISDRGVLRPGAAADMLLLDRDALAAGATPRFVADFPAGTGRYVVDADGYVAVIVNGEPLLERGKPTGALPGRVLRSR
jgi:N-acyl-D-aspartate/D-glutamate deacylase